MDHYVGCSTFDLKLPDTTCGSSKQVRSHNDSCVFMSIEGMAKVFKCGYVLDSGTH